MMRPNTPPRALAILDDDRNRRCGPCTECCDAAAVPELNKPAGKRCEHLIPGKGCDVYETRPESCKTFRCLWLDGVGKKKHRPDLLGVFLAIYEVKDAPEVIDVPGVLAAKNLNGKRRTICAIETHKNGARDAEHVLREIRAVAPLHVIEYGT